MLRSTRMVLYLMRLKSRLRKQHLGRMVDTLILMLLANMDRCDYFCAFGSVSEVQPLMSWVSRKGWDTGKAGRRHSLLSSRVAFRDDQPEGLRIKMNAIWIWRHFPGSGAIDAMHSQWDSHVWITGWWVCIPSICCGYCFEHMMKYPRLNTRTSLAHVCICINVPCMNAQDYKVRLWIISSPAEVERNVIVFHRLSRWETWRNREWPSKFISPHEWGFTQTLTCLP